MALDFSLLPDVSLAPIAWFPRSDILKELNARSLPETAARFEGTVMFGHKVAVNNELPSDDARRREAYLRAALAEYSSMEDALICDLGKNAAHLMRQSPNPLVHFTRMLRNLNIHLTPTSLDSKQIQAIWGGAGPGGKDYSFELTIWTITDLTVKRLLALRDIEKYYKKEELSEMCDWFDKRQQSWGAADLIRRAAEIYAAEILV